MATPADAVLKSIQRAAGPDLQRVILFDVFDDPTKMGPHHKSLAFRLTFQSMTGTLSENQIQGYVAHILEAVRLKVGAILRE